MSYEYYSVVAAYSNNGGLWYYRLADIDINTNKVVEAHYNTEDNEYLYEPVSFRSKTPIKEKYKTTIIKWKYDEYDETRQYIEQANISGKIYEIVFLHDNVENQEFNVNKVREELSTGFYVDESLNNEFLLVVGKKDKYFVALRCNQHMFKQDKVSIESDMIMKCLYIDKDAKNLVNSISMLEIYNIPEDSIITIDNLLDHRFSKNVDITSRFFYEELHLPKKAGNFFVRNAADYIVNFFTKYLKDTKEVFELSNKDRNKFISIMQSIKNEETLVDEFVDASGYSSDDLTNVFKEFGSQVIDVLQTDSEMNKALKNFILQDEIIYEECLKQIKENWENSYDFKQLQKEREEKEISLLNEIDLSTNELNKIKKEINDFEIKKKLLNDEVDQLIEKKITINSEIDQTLKQYKEDIVTVIKNVAPLELVSKVNSDSSKTKGYTHKKNRDISNLDSYECVEKGDCKELYEDLNDNISLFYSNSRSGDIAASILSTIANSKSVVVDEAIGEIIANSISLLCDKKFCDMYTVYGADVDVSRLCCSISKNENQIIYINGALNSFNEQLLKLLVSTFHKKLFIFSVDVENLENLSKGIWKYATYIDLGKDYEGRSINKKFIISDYCICECKKISITPIKIDKKLKQSHLLSDYQIFDLSRLSNIYTYFITNAEFSTFYINQVVLNIGIRQNNLRNQLCTIYDENSINDGIFLKQQVDEL